MNWKKNTLPQNIRTITSFGQLEKTIKKMDNEATNNY